MHSDRCNHPGRLERHRASRRVAAPFLALALAGATAAAAPAAGIHGKMISYEANGEKVAAYLARPARAHAPGVVVVHEWWGLNDQIKGVADRLASAGYLALVPDLYRGTVAADAELAHELMRGLNEDRAVSLIQGAVTELRAIDGDATRPIGTIGFCMGGRLSLATALKGSDIQSAVMFYGSVETTEAAVAPLQVPLLGIFGAEDRGIGVEDVRKFEAALKGAGKQADIVIYPGVGHAFFNENNPGHNAELARDAWKHTLEFFAAHLKPALEKQTPPDGKRSGR